MYDPTCPACQDRIAARPHRHRQPLARPRPGQRASRRGGRGALGNERSSWQCGSVVLHPILVRGAQRGSRRQSGREAPEDLHQLPYTRAVFDEALRLYPPVPAIQRKTVTRTTLGGMTLPAGAIILVGLYNMHRHPAFWPDPERFLPERWLNDERTSPRRAYMPFGAGPRACVGTHFATMEGTLLLALIGRRYDPQLAQERVEPEVMVTLRPKHGIRMTLQPRHQRVASA